MSAVQCDGSPILCCSRADPPGGSVPLQELPSAVRARRATIMRQKRHPVQPRPIDLASAMLATLAMENRVRYARLASTPPQVIRLPVYPKLCFELLMLLLFI